MCISWSVMIIAHASEAAAWTERREQKTPSYARRCPVRNVNFVCIRGPDAGNVRNFSAAAIYALNPLTRSSSPFGHCLPPAPSPLWECADFSLSFPFLGVRLNGKGGLIEFRRRGINILFRFRFSRLEQNQITEIPSKAFSAYKRLRRM